MISDKQFGDLARSMNQEGGFTVNTQTGDGPPSGFMVAKPEHGENGMPMPMSGPRIKSYAESRGGVLKQPNHYLGGWHNTETSKGALDVSTHTPANVGGLLKATKQGQGEDAIGVFGPGGKAGIGSAYSKEKPSYAGDFPTSLIKRSPDR